MLRKAGARTKEALWSEIGRVIENYSQSECLNLFKNSGYAT